MLTEAGDLWCLNIDGTEVWHRNILREFSGGNIQWLISESPLIDGDVVVAMSGYGGPALAVKGGGSGDVTETHRLWHQVTPKPPQRVGSGVVANGHVFILNENFVAWCLDPRTGEKKWEERVGTQKSWCSMVHAAGRIYITNKDGTTYVLKPNPEALDILAENKLGEHTEAVLKAVLGEAHHGAEPNQIGAKVTREELVPQALAQLSTSGIGIAEFALAQPSLDDVFLALTGKPVETMDAEVKK